MSKTPNYLVSILMGSESDWETMEHCQKMLADFGVTSDMRVLSAHRTPQAVQEYLKASIDQGVQLFIAAAGMAAHLAGAVAAHSVRPVIGVPLDGSSLHGMDALLATVQMPAGIPVATVAIGKAGAKNAAILAVQILALQDASLNEKLLADRKKNADKILKDAKRSLLEGK